MGEVQIITYLAKDFIEKGNDIYLAIENAMITFKMALKEASEYNFNGGSRKYKTERNKKIKNLYEDEFIENQKIVRAIAYKRYRFLHKSNNYDDVLQTGYLSLWKAIHTFDPAKHESRKLYYNSHVWHDMGRYINRQIRKRQKNKGIDFDFEFVSLETYALEGKEGWTFLKDFIKDPADTHAEAENNIAIDQILEYSKKVNDFKANRNIYEILNYLLADFDYEYIAEMVECSSSEAYKIVKRFTDRYKGIIDYDISR